MSEHPDFGDTHDALLHLLTSQTSCYRYWGLGLWTDFGCEVCRRAREIQAHDY